MTEENPLSPLGWSQRYSSAQSRVDEAYAAAPINAQRQALIHRSELDRELRLGNISDHEHKRETDNINSHMAAIVAERGVRPSTVDTLSQDDVFALRFELMNQIRAKQEALILAEAEAAKEEKDKPVPDEIEDLLELHTPAATSPKEEDGFAMEDDEPAPVSIGVMLEDEPVAPPVVEKVEPKANAAIGKRGRR